MEIELYLDGEWEPVVDSLRSNLGVDAEMRVRAGGGAYLTTVLVDVLAANTQNEALDRIQPAVWLADPGCTRIVGGTSTMQLVVPRPTSTQPESVSDRRVPRQRPQSGTR